MAVDPVCKMDVDEEHPPGGKAQFWGQTYYFCAPGCRAQFQRQPTKYVERGTAPAEPSYDPRMFMGDM